jgi:hypothetical protein
VSISVLDVTAPVAQAGSFSVDQNGSKSGAVLASDSDGDTLSYTLVAAPSHGTLSLAPDASYTYTPAANYHGLDSFSFQASDGTNASNVATISVSVLDVTAPVAQTASFGVDQNGSKSGAVLASDSDGDTLSYSLVTAPSHGTLSLNSDGSYLYTAALGYSGNDSFSFVANDGTLSSNPAEVLVTINATTPVPVQPVRDTPAVLDPSTGTWGIRNSSGTGLPDSTFRYGLPGWVGVVGDWNGDGHVTVGVIDGTGVSDPSYAVWYLRNGDGTGAPDHTPFVFGLRTWIPVVGDWIGSGRTGIGMYDPSTATWYLRNSAGAGAPDFVFRYGWTDWKPVVGDWNGDGKVTVGVVDANGVWYLRDSNTAGPTDFAPFSFGLGSWTPIAGDWSGQGKTTVGMVDNNGVWYLRNSNSAGVPDAGQFAYGLGGWQPLPGKFAAPSSVPPADSVTGLRAAMPSPVPEANIDPSVVRVLQSPESTKRPWTDDPVNPTEVGKDEVLPSNSPTGPVETVAAPSSDLPGLQEIAHVVGTTDVGPLVSPNDLTVDPVAAGVRRIEALDTLFATLA